MAGYRPALNDRQRDVLRWIAEGCPAGTFTGYGHRGSARVLEARELVRIKGRGAQWTATITAAGQHYLKHGAYPDPPLRMQRETARRPEKPEVERGASQPVREPERPSPRRAAVPHMSKTDLLISEVQAAPGQRLIKPTSNESGLRRLVSIAESREKAPAGTTLMMKYDYRAKEATLWFEPLPAWRLEELVPVPVPARLTQETDVVKKLRDRWDLKIQKNRLGRALRIVEAITRESRARGYKVTPVKAPPNRPLYRDEIRDPTTIGHLRVDVDGDAYRLSVFQAVDLVADGSGRPYARKREIPTDRLGVRIHDTAHEHWGSSWQDRGDTMVETMLPKVLRELELRHSAASAAREERDRAERSKRERWGAARQEAIARLYEAHRAHVLLDQIERRRLAITIRAFVKEIKDALDESTTVEDQQRATEWADWASRYADEVDPLQGPVGMPEPPSIPREALAEYMKPWSVDGPYEATPVPSYGYAPATAAAATPSWWSARHVPAWRR